MAGISALTGDGVDVALDGIGGRVALRSYRALRRGGRLVMYGHYGTTIAGRKSAKRVALFYLSGAPAFASNLLPDGKRVLAFQVAKLRGRHPNWFRQDATTLFGLLAERKTEPIVAERIPLAEAGGRTRTSAGAASPANRSSSAMRTPPPRQAASDGPWLSRFHLRYHHRSDRRIGAVCLTANSRIAKATERPGRRIVALNGPVQSSACARWVSGMALERTRGCRRDKALAWAAALGGAVCVAVAGCSAWNQLTGGLPTSTPSCSWPLRVHGHMTGEQAGLIRCYLRALARHDTAGLLAVAFTANGPVRITARDFRHAADARAGVATAMRGPQGNDLAYAVTIMFADNATETVAMAPASPATVDSWRLGIGTLIDSTGGPPPAKP